MQNRSDLSRHLPEFFISDRMAPYDQKVSPRRHENYSARHVSRVGLAIVIGSSLLCWGVALWWTWQDFVGTAAAAFAKGGR